MTQPENSLPIPETEVRAAYLENALRQGGVLYDATQNALTEPTELSPSEVCDVIIPPREPGVEKQPRFELIEGASAAVKSGVGERAESILALADQVDMRHAESIDETTLAKIDPKEAVWCIEAGANRTSVVRRALALDAMGRIYGDDVVGKTAYQFGSERKIAQTRKDGSANPEYTVAREIAGDDLPENLTEFDLNVASAMRAGFEITEEDGMLVGRKANAPKVVFVRQQAKGGLKSGFSALAELGLANGRQLVIATNGQYRPKDEQQAVQWAAERNADMLPPVAIGDEEGYTVEHAGASLNTARRNAVAYANEMVILHRQANR